MIRPQFPLLPKQLVIASLVASLPWLAGPALAQTAGLTRAQRELLDRHCSECHNQDDFAGGIAFDLLDTGNLLHDAETWEKVLLKLQAGMMPPLGEPRPAAAAKLPSCCGAKRPTPPGSPSRQPGRPTTTPLRLHTTPARPQRK